VRRSGIVIALAFMGAIVLLGAAVSSGASGAEVCATTGPRVCVVTSDTPATVPPSEVGSPRYVSYVAQITNRAQSSATHVAASVQLSAGLVLFSASSSVGSCTAVDGQPGCTLGKLARGATATIEVIARSPQTEGTASASFKVSFDESVNDAPTVDPKQDTISVTEETTVAAVSGSASSFVPEGGSVRLSTDPTDAGTATPGDPLIAQASIKNAPTSVTALIEELAAPFSCPKRTICRGGDWLHASIPGTFAPPLTFGFRWDRSLIPSGLTAKKFSVLYTECLDGCRLQVVSARCSSSAPAASELPCLTGVAKLSDGDWVASLLNSHNGYMK
jgi:hypothetical protein